MVKWPIVAAVFAELSYLVVRIHEAELDGSPLELVFDAHVPAPGTARRRQVDLLVLAGQHGAREIVEVQHRRAKVGQPFVDQVEGKMVQLSAQVATIVASAGFTADALSRINTSNGRLRAVHVREPQSSDWPIPANFEFRFDTVGTVSAVTPQVRAEAKWADGEPTFMVTGAQSPDGRFATWLTVARMASGEFHIRNWNLDCSNQIRTIRVELSTNDRSSGKRDERVLETDEWVSVPTGNL